jgi:hypothetical protein
MDACRRLFLKSFETFNQHDVSMIYSNESHDVNPEVLGGKYMSKKVHDNIKKNLHIKVDQHYIFDNTTVYLSVYCKDRTYQFEQLYNILNFYIHTLNKVQHKPELRIILYLCEKKKVFPRRDDIVLNEDHVNSGVTMFNEHERCVVVYRKEEIMKVLLHELIHCYEIDFHNYNFKHDRHLIRKFRIQVQKPWKNVNTPLALYESYTDSLACYGHAITYCLFKQHNKNTVDLNRNIDSVLLSETNHYLRIAAKVYKFSKLMEDTHCFSYYIAKAAIFRNFPDFLKIIKENNGLKIDSEIKQERYLNFLRLLLNEKYFWTLLENTDFKRISLSSLKMTSIRW